MIEIGAIASENTNLTLGTLESIEARSRGVRTTSLENDSEEVSISFEDIIDIINPLQHIPVISALYRSLADEDISPVSRIAGDALYGGIMGVASAALGALGAIGDEAFSSLNGGESVADTVIAAVFGNDAEDPPQTQLANATQANGEVKVAMASLVPPAEKDGADTTTNKAPNIQNEEAAKNLAQATSSLPFGGVMAPLPANAEQTRALAESEATKRQGIEAQRSARSNRFAVATMTQKASTNVERTAANVEYMDKAEPETQAALQNLLQEIKAMKGLSQYKNAAQNTATTGASVDIYN